MTRLPPNFDTLDPSASPLQRIIAPLKIPVVVFAGVFTTLGLLYLMQFLIDSSEKKLDESPSVNLVDFVRIRQDQQVAVKQRKAEPPPLPDEPPPPIRQEITSIEVSEGWNQEMTAPDPDVDLTGSSSFTSDGEYLPIIKVQPVYPQAALARGQYGWVVVEFTVDAMGRVVNPIVVDHCVTTMRSTYEPCHDQPASLFDRAALRAARKFKYKPRVVDGAPIETAGVRNLISFELNELDSKRAYVNR